MRAIQLAAAASLAAAGVLAAPATPAQAQSLGDTGFGDLGDLRSFEFVAPPRRHFGHDRRGHRDHRRHRGRSDTVVIGPLGWNDGWALYNNRTFDSDSYNDWWHDRPDRAFPRWVRDNQDCRRLWWSGGGWRC